MLKTSQEYLVKAIEDECVYFRAFLMRTKRVHKADVAVDNVIEAIVTRIYARRVQ